jgi:endo-1,4-beta-xylanase
MQRNIKALPLVLLAAAVSCSRTDYNEAVEAVFHSKDPFIQQVVIPNIEKNRKSDYTLRFTDERGNPLAGLRIKGALRRHKFLFGACPPETPQALDPRCVAAWSSLFNYGVAQNALKWAHVEGEKGLRNFKRADEMADLCAKHGIVLEYHFLTGYHPDWLDELPDDEKACTQKEFALEAVERYKDKIRFFQVYNEDQHTHISRAEVYFDQSEFFIELVKKYPRVKFGVSDCWSLNGLAPPPDADEMKQKYPGISYIAIHGHKPRGLWASPKEMYKNFDKYLDSGIKIHVSEFGIMKGHIEGGYREGEWTEQNKAEYFVQARVVAFSHPAVEAFNHWTMGPGEGTWAANALLNDDCTPKPAYRALENLIKHKLTTSIGGITDEQGEYHFRGFHGQYEIIAENQAGNRASAVFDVDAENTQRNFVVEDAGNRTATLKVVD